jgi:hypothetical protein
VVANSIGGHKSIAVFPATRPITVVAAPIAVAAPRAFLPRLVLAIDEVAIAEVARSANEIALARSVAATTLPITGETLRPSAVAFRARLVNAGPEILPARLRRWATARKFAAFTIARGSPVTQIQVTSTICVTDALRLAIRSHSKEITHLVVARASSSVFSLRGWRPVARIAAFNASTDARRVRL